MARLSTEVKARSKAKPAALSRRAGLARLLEALFRQVHVGPAGEAVLLVPDAFAVAQQDELVHGLAAPRGGNG